MFCVVAIECWVRQISCATCQCCWEGICHTCFSRVKRWRCFALAEDSPQSFNVCTCCGFVQRHANLRRADLTQVVARCLCCCVYRCSICNIDCQCIEERAVSNRHAHLFQTSSQSTCQTMSALGDLFQASWAMVDRVHGSNHCQQYLRCTNVRRRFFAADMLFTCLQSQTVSLFPLRINSHTDQTAWHRTFKRIFSAHITSVWTTETERHTEALAVTDDDVSTPCAWRFDQGQCQQIGSSDHHRAFSMDSGCEFAVIADFAINTWVLQEYAEAVVFDSFIACQCAYFYAQRFSTCFDDFTCLWQDVMRYIEHVRVRFTNTLDQGHRFCRGCTFVEHRRIRDIHACHIHDDLLEVQNRF